MSDGVGNSAQVRVIAEQLFEVWKTEQAREAKETRRFFGSNIGGWVAMLVLIGTGIATASNINNLASDANARSIKNENAISQMKTANSDRLARIETKIDLMMEERKR